jgi:hypothetical protein
MEGGLQVRVHHESSTPAHNFHEVYRKSRESPEEQQERDITDKLVPSQTLKLTDQYLALLVIILTNAGLCQVRYTINGKLGEKLKVTLGTYLHA